MLTKKALRVCVFAGLLVSALGLPGGGWTRPAPARAAPAARVTAFDLIIAMNTLRVSNGLRALEEDAIINAVAQSTAQTMAAQQMSWHIGNVSGRLAAAGYGGGAKVWATENFAVGNLSIDQIIIAWSDASHMIPAVNPAYCHVGAGVADSANGMTYYVLQAAYVAGKSCGEYRSSGNSGSGSGSSGNTGGVSQLIVPVKVAEPDSEGKIFHVVQPGQSLWAIAIAYKVTIKDIEFWNNLIPDSKLQVGQRLFIPGKNTVGYATPTPVGMVQVNPADPDGRIVHEVQPYQTLSTIAQAYKVTVDTLLVLNGLQVDWPLQIGQKLVIARGNFTPSPTLRPLTPLERLTPASDGNYYHVIQSGETLSWIASLYEVTAGDLAAWNGLNLASILYPEQKLLLRVTPPATGTPTPGPPTATPPDTPTTAATATLEPVTPTPSQPPVQAAGPPVVPPTAPAAESQTDLLWFISFSLVAGGLFLAFFLTRKKS
jgi:LysM repeat protein